MIDKLALIVIRDSQILVARSVGRDSFFIPGGKREPGETDEDALVREVAEEISVHLERSLLKFYKTFVAQAHGQPEGTLVQMRCYMAQVEAEVLASAEIEEVAWLSYEQRTHVSEAARLVFDDLKHEGLLQ